MPLSTLQLLVAPMAGHSRGAAESDAQMLHELQTLSRSLSRAQASRRADSLALPRPSNAIPAADGDGPKLDFRADRSDRRSQSSRRISLSSWRSRQKPQHDLDGDGGRHPDAAEQKRGIWSWKPMRALAHLAMRRVACLFSVEVVAVRRLPAAVNGLRLSVAVRKKETKDGALQTMPSRVLQGCAEFEETLCLQCHLYCSGGAGTGKPIRFDPRPFLISVVAVDASQLDLGTSIVDLCSLVKESIQKNLEGQRVRLWDTVFALSGKATGGELVLKLTFQIMEDGGLGIYKQTEVTKSDKEKKSNFSISRIQPKSSFSPASPSAISANIGSIPRDSEATKDLKLEDFDLPEFDVIDIGIEIEEERDEEEEVASEDAAESSEVVKEMVHDRAQRSRLKELHLIAREIKELELTMGEAEKSTPQNKFQKLDSDEETVTREFLQMLETEDSKESNSGSINVVSSLDLGERRSDEDDENSVLIPDLGKNLGIVVQTRDGGYLASMNPFNLQVSRKETPKLAMQISSELILTDERLASGFDLLNKLAAMGSEQLSSKLLSLTAMDELVGKTAGQVALEGIASAVINGRKKEGASSSAARSIATVKKMAAAMNKGRKERLSTGIWRVNEEALTVDEIFSHSLQKMEAMAVDALKVQGEVADEEAPFDASPLIEHDESPNFLDSAIAPEDWLASCSSSSSRILLLVVIQLRDPVRGYEAVGAPMIAVTQAVADGDDDDGQAGEERRFNLTSLHVGGLKLSSSSKRRSVWDGEKQRLTAMHWLVENGLRSARKVMKPQAKRGQDLLWSVSSRTTSGVWIKHVRNPNLKVASSNSE